MYLSNYHHGNRLKFFVEKSSMTLVKISEKSNVPKSSFYDLYKKNEIIGSKLKAILDVLGVDEREFFDRNYSEVSEPVAHYGLDSEIVTLRRENELLRLTVETQKQLIEILKDKKK